MSDPTHAVIDHARQHAVATLHEAAGRIGALPAAIKPAHPGFRLCGPAFVVSCPPGDNLPVHLAVSMAAAGDVLVVDVGGSAGHEYGYWGEILSEAARARDLGGVVLDGGARDLDQLATVGFPVFARSICIRGTVKGHESLGARPAQIRLGDVVVRSGDLVVGDRDGVVALPLADLAQIVARSDERERHEATVMARLRQGETTMQIYGWDR